MSGQRTDEEYKNRDDEISAEFFRLLLKPKELEEKYFDLYNVFSRSESFDLDTSDFFTSFCKGVIYDLGLFNVTKNTAKAIEYYQKNPNCFYSLHKLGLMEKDIQKKKEYYKKCVKSNPTFYQAYNNLAILYHEEKNASMAIQYYNLALKHFPSSDEKTKTQHKEMIIYNLALVYSDILHDYSFAVKLYKEVLTIDGEHYEAIYNLAWVYLNAISVRNLETCKYYLFQAMEINRVYDKRDKQVKLLFEDYKNAIQDLQNEIYGIEQRYY